MDSGDEDYCDSDTPLSDYYNSDEDSDDQNIDENIEPSNHFKKNYTVLSEADIHQRQLDAMDEVTAVLSVPKEAASILLRNYRWNPTAVNDAWFSDEEKVRKSIGLLLLDPAVVNNMSDDTTKRTRCSICYEKKRLEKFLGTTCGHLFCAMCWKQYVGTAVDEGPGCLKLRCPDPKCRTVVGPDLIDRLISDLDRKKYDKYLVRSYVEGNKKIKWCPAPGCDYAVEYEDAGTSGAEAGGGYDVVCECSNEFCWNCTEDAHRAVRCDTVAKWMLKCQAESENTAWILAYTKPCPKCKRSIEKNEGCMHMTCGAPCGYEFCWLCLKEWEGHKGFYNCNTYEEAKREGIFNEDEEKRELAKSLVERYMHYYERWSTNDKSREKALQDLRELKNGNLVKLSQSLSEPLGQLEFIQEAWVQIVECRRVLKWTYAYGYYITDKEQAKKMFFEYLQGEAEACLEKIHHCVEIELNSYVGANKSSNDFNNFRIKLKELTNATHTYFENLVKALMDGLSEVGSKNA